MSESESIFRRISSMEPLLPESARTVLAGLSAEIFRKSGELKQALPSAIVRLEVAKLVREMNSYYSNLIEGHKTLPREIERALRQDFSDKPDVKRNQQLGVAHIQAEQAMRERLASDTEVDVFSPDFVCWLHREFYCHLPLEEHVTTSKTGQPFPLTPGATRNYNVDVGHHTPPDHDVLGAFLERFQAFYSSGQIPATDHLIAIAAAHHRLAWIHPFGDGNGRVARLHSQAALIRTGVDADGLWTLSRGLARDRPAYFRLLQAADRQRTSDLDGRGNLSDKALAEFCEFFLRAILDQIEFMIDLVSPRSLRQRITGYLQFERLDLDLKLRGHLGKLLAHLCIEGELQRGCVMTILGLKDTAARDVIRKALADGLVSSRSEKGALRIAFPLKVRESYFPKLFTDLPTGGD